MKFDVNVVGIPRDMFVECLAAEGYRVRAGYVEPLYRNQIYQKRIFMGSKGLPFSENSRDYDDCYSPDGFPVCERVQNSELIIGDIVYPPLISADIDHFIEDCCKILDQAKKDFKDTIFLSFEQTKDKKIAKFLDIDYWTTIVVYKNNKETSRSIGQTNKEEIYSQIKSK